MQKMGKKGRKLHWYFKTSPVFFFLIENFWASFIQEFLKNSKSFYINFFSLNFKLEQVSIYSASARLQISVQTQDKLLNTNESFNIQRKFLFALRYLLGFGLFFNMQF